MFGHQQNPECRSENPNRKTLNDFKSSRGNSAADIQQTNSNLESEKKKEESDEKIQMITFVNLLKRQFPNTKTASPSLSEKNPSRTLIQPEFTKLTMQRPPLLKPSLEWYNLSLDEITCTSCNGGVTPSPLSSSANSSIPSTSKGFDLASQTFEPTFKSESRRNSTITNKCSTLDALNLEYALIEAATRGSLGPYSLSQSLQKLSFTQSLAFPALARGISNKKNFSQNNTEEQVSPLDSGVNAFAKVATVLALMLFSVLVFGVLYKFIRT